MRERNIFLVFFIVLNKCIKNNWIYQMLHRCAILWAEKISYFNITFCKQSLFQVCNVKNVNNEENFHIIPKMFNEVWDRVLAELVTVLYVHFLHHIMSFKYVVEPSLVKIAILRLASMSRRCIKRKTKMSVTRRRHKRFTWHINTRWILFSLPSTQLKVNE